MIQSRVSMIVAKFSDCGEEMIKQSDLPTSRAVDVQYAYLGETSLLLEIELVERKFISLLCGDIFFFEKHLQRHLGDRLGSG